MSLLFRHVPGIGDAIVVICDWCGQPVSGEDGLFLWQERSFDVSASEPFAWKRQADGPAFHAGDLIFLHKKICEGLFEKINGPLPSSGRRMLWDLPADIAISFTPGARAALEPRGSPPPTHDLQ